MKLMRAARSILILCLAVSLSGCASIPLQKTVSYWQNLYRRIPYKVDGNYRVIDIFYATDRTAREGSEASPAFTRDLADKLTYGTLNVKIDPSITIGKMLPNRLKRFGTIGIQEVRKTDEDAFLKQIADAVAASPHDSLLVLIFGYNDDFEATAIKASYFSYLLDVNTPVLLFDWPGDQPVSLSGYFKAQSNAKASGAYLGELLTKIIRQMKPKNLWIQSSSMGCQVVCDAFDHMVKYDDLSDADAEIAHVVLAAPDVGKNEFDEQFKGQLASLSKKLTAYVSSDDDALLLSGFINREQRLGRQRIKEPGQLQEANELLYMKSLEPDKVALIDVTPINNSSYKHGYYLESPEFYDDFYLRIFGKEANVNRHLYLLKSKDNTDYWVLRGNK